MCHEPRSLPWFVLPLDWMKRCGKFSNKIHTFSWIFGEWSTGSPKSFVYIWIIWIQFLLISFWRGLWPQYVSRPNWCDFSGEVGTRPGTSGIPGLSFVRGHPGPVGRKVTIIWPDLKRSRNGGTWTNTRSFCWDLRLQKWNTQQKING